MASGYFPLGKHDDGHKELLRAAEAVEKVADDYYTWVCENSDQIDNAASDGTYIGCLEAAAVLIRKCLRGET